MVDDSPRLNAWITSELIILVLLAFLFFCFWLRPDENTVSYRGRPFLATREQLPVPGEYGGSPFMLKLNAPAGTAGFHLYSCHFQSGSPCFSACLSCLWPVYWYWDHRKWYAWKFRLRSRPDMAVSRINSEYSDSFKKNKNNRLTTSNSLFCHSYTFNWSIMS